MALEAEVELRAFAGAPDRIAGPGVAGQKSRLRPDDFLWPEGAGFDQRFVAIDTILAIVCVIQRLVGTVDDIGRRVIGRQAAEADADGDMGNTAEDGFFDRGGGAVEVSPALMPGRCRLRRNTSSKRKALAHDLGDHDQDFRQSDGRKVSLTCLK